MSSKSIRSALALGQLSTSIILAAAGVAMSAGSASGETRGGPPSARSDDTSTRSLLLHAEDLLNRGQLIRAGDVLGMLGDIEAMADGDATRARDLIGSLERRLKTADPVELGIQKAEVASARGDLAAMNRHLDRAERTGDMGFAQESRVAQLRGEAEAIRGSLEAVAGDFETQAAADFESGRFGRAKSTLMILTRAGVGLSPEADAIRRSIFDLELSRGAPFTAAEAAGLFEPGVLERVAADELELPAIALFGDVAFDDQPGVIRREGDDRPAAEQPEDQDPPADDILDRSLRVAAQEKLVTANRAYQNANYATAIQLYDELLASDRPFLTPEQINTVNERLLASRVALDQPTDPDQPLRDFEEELAIRRDRTDAEFNNFINQAEQALAEDETQEARDAVAQARLTLGASRDIYAESEFETRQDRMTSILERIASEEIRIQTQEAEELTRQLRIQQEVAAREEEQSRQAKINEQLDRARALQLDLKYDEALQVLDQVLFLAPNDPAALLMRDIIYDISLVRRFSDIRRLRAREFTELQIDNLEASKPITDLMTFPNDWPRVSLNRGEPVAVSESPENRRVLAELETQRIQSVNFDNPLSDVVGFLEAVTSQNFDVDWQSLELLSIDEQTPVTLRLNNVSVKTVLDRLVDKISDPLAPADWAIQDGIVQIASDEELRRDTTLVIYDIRDLLIEVPDYQDAPEIDLQSVLQSQQGGGGGQSPFGGDTQGGDDEERDRQERIDQIIDIIQNNVDFEGWQANGGDTGFIQELNGSLIITNTSKNHREVQGLLGQIRAQRAMQINVETRFLLVNQDFFEEIGFDIDVYLNANNNQIGVARGNDPTIQASDFFAFDPGLTAPDSGQGLQRTVSGASIGADGTTASVTQGVVNPDEFSPIGVGQNSLGLAESLAIGDFATSILGAAPALGVAGQFLNDIQVDFLVKATQADRRSVQLTAPRLTFTNGQIANIVVATQTAFVSQLNPVVATSAVGFDPTISVVSEGVTLEVEGTVSSDRRYVTLNVQTGVSRIDGFAQQPVTAVVGGDIVDSADTQSFIQLPTVTVTRIQTTVTVPDQGTVLLGGQRLVTEFEVETGVPVVSKIPVINRFFTNRVESKEEQTLLVLIKPTILIQSEEEERNFPGLTDTIQNSFGG
ncbi:MAG: hypothetical protein AAF937_06750 [Planctomycetota bacterium]